MPTLLLPPRYTPDTNAIWQAAVAAGWETERVHGWRVHDDLRGTDVVLYGEPLFAAVVADQLGLALLEPTFDWVAALPDPLRKRRVEFTTLAEARRLTEPSFVKPADDKCFRAGVFASGDELPVEAVLPGSTPVLVAEPVEWEIEFRCFVLEGRVVAHSAYLRRGNLNRAEDGSWPATNEEVEVALAFAAEVLSDVAVPPGVVLDVGVIEGRGWAVVEANAAWGSGIYGCDPSAMLPVIARSCCPRAKVREEDRRWVIRS